MQAKTQEGKKEIYDTLTQEIANSKLTLDSLNARIQDRKIIEGKAAWSNAYKTLLGAGALLTLAAGADVATGGENIRAIASSVAGAIRATKEASGPVASAAWAAVKSRASDPVKLFMGVMSLTGLVSNIRLGIAIATLAAQTAKGFYNSLAGNPSADPVAVKSAQTEAEELQKLNVLITQYNELAKKWELTKDPKIAEQLKELKNFIEPLAIKYKAQLQKAQEQIAAQQAQQKK